MPDRTPVKTLPDQIGMLMMPDDDAMLLMMPDDDAMIE